MWRVVAFGFLVDNSGLSGLCSKVNELITIRDFSVLLAMASFEHGNRIELLLDVGLMCHGGFAAPCLFHL